MITNIKKFINSIFSIKIGDIIYDGDPKNVVRPSYKIVCGENEMITRKVIFNIKEMVFDDSYYSGKIYKIEDIKIEDIKYILKMLISDNSDDRKKLFGNVFDVWIKRYPIVKKLISDAELNYELDSNVVKYNL